MCLATMLMSVQTLLALAWEGRGALERRRRRWNGGAAAAGALWNCLADDPWLKGSRIGLEAVREKRQAATAMGASASSAVQMLRVQARGPAPLLSAPSLPATLPASIWQCLPPAAAQRPTVGQPCGRLGCL